MAAHGGGVGGRNSLVIGCAVAAAVLLAASWWLPLWRMSLAAPQYPKGLELVAYGNRVEGDLKEINILNHYVGMEKIQEVPAPEMALFPYTLVVLILATLAAPFVGRTFLKLTLLATIAVPVVTLVDLQWWLYIFGQNLDPHAPLSFIKPFTPLALGTSKVGNFSSSAMISWGIGAMLGAAALDFFALRRWPRAASPRPEETA